MRSVSLSAIPAVASLYWKTTAFAEVMQAGETVYIAAQYNGEVPASLLNDKVEISGVKGTARFTIFGIWKPGFDFNSGKVKAGHVIFGLRADGVASTGLAGYSVLSLLGVPVTALTAPKDAVNAVGNVLPPNPTGAAGTKDVGGLADFLERAVMPIAILVGLFLVVKMFLKRS